MENDNLNESTPGYGNCPDCIWYGVPEGCNVDRGTPLCKINYKERKDNETNMW